MILFWGGSNYILGSPVFFLGGIIMYGHHPPRIILRSHWIIYVFVGGLNFIQINMGNFEGFLWQKLCLVWVGDRMTPDIYQLNYHPLRIQVCPKKGIIHTSLFFSDGIGTLIPIRSGRVWISRDQQSTIHVGKCTSPNGSYLFFSFWVFFSLPETKSKFAPEKMAGPKRKGKRLPNINVHLYLCFRKLVSCTCIQQWVEFKDASTNQAICLKCMDICYENVSDLKLEPFCWGDCHCDITMIHQVCW